MATYSGRLEVAKSFIRQQWSIALGSCSADMVFILGTPYLYLGVLRVHKGLGMRSAYSSLVSPDALES